MVQTSNVAKRQKVEECTSCMDMEESVMFNSDSLFRIASYLSADGLLNLALTCQRFGIGGDSLSLIEETARRIIQDIATDEQLNALPSYDDGNWLCKYNYLQLLRAPLTFDQLVGSIEHVKGNKSCVANRHGVWATAFSNNIMMAGKHYVSFQADQGTSILFSVHVGVMRPGEAMQNTEEVPLEPRFYNHFTQGAGSVQYNNSVNCCMYDTYSGSCLSSDWVEGDFDMDEWNGIERASDSCTIGMLLDLDEGTLSVYNNGRKLGVMKRGLAGHYCWVVSLSGGTQVTIKRGTVPEN